MSADVELGDTFSVDDKVYGGSIALGISKKISNGTIRGELEYNKNSDAEKTHPMYVTDSIDIYKFDGKLEIKTKFLMLNGYYDFDTGTKFTPYIGAGVGFAKVEGELSALGESESIDDNNFAWQIGAGISYAVSDNVSFDAGYRYVDYDDFEKYDIKVDTSAHELYVGARYSFK